MFDIFWCVTLCHCLGADSGSLYPSSGSWWSVNIGADEVTAQLRPLPKLRVVGAGVIQVGEKW